MIWVASSAFSLAAANSTNRSRSRSRSRFFSRQVVTRARSRVGLKGLGRKSSAPDSMHFTALSICSAPEMTMTGSPLKSGLALRATSTSMPFISGISMSSNIRSKGFVSTSSSACRPLAASVMLRKPRVLSARISASRMVRLSSTTSTAACCNGPSPRAAADSSGGAGLTASLGFGFSSFIAGSLERREGDSRGGATRWGVTNHFADSRRTGSSPAWLVQVHGSARGINGIIRPTFASNSSSRKGLVT